MNGKLKRLPLGERLQVLLRNTARSPIRTLFAFLAVNVSSYIVYSITIDDKLPSPFTPALKYLSELKIPIVMRKSVYKAYGKLYGVNFEEIKEPLDKHERFIDFFCREVKQRTLIEDEKLVISPCDSKILTFGEVTESHTEVVKGFKYSIGRFLTGQDVQLEHTDLNRLKKDPNNKLYHVTLYLSPGDYHRFHSPSKFTIVNRQHYGSDLYSVDPRFLSTTSKPIYELNKRMCLVGRSPTGYLNMILVGAKNVGDIIVHGKETFEKGEELGMFKLGSTIVMIFEAPSTLQWSKEAGERIKFGEMLYQI